MVKSPVPDIDIPNITLHDLAFETFCENGDKVALIDGLTGGEYTFRELLRVCKNVASGLARLGVKKNDVIAIFSPNSTEYAILFFAISAAGATYTTLNSSFTVYEVRKQLTDSNALFLYTTTDLLDTARDAAAKYGKIRKIIVPETAVGCISLLNLMNDDGTAFPENLTFDPVNDVLSLPYSSGTTGVPKGVMLTHKNLISTIFMASHDLYTFPPLNEMKKKNVQYTNMVLLPMYHMYGQFLVLATLLSGNKAVIIPKFIPELFLGSIEKYKINNLAIVPPLAIFLAKSPLVAKYDLSSIRSVVCGAAALSKDTQMEVCQKLGVQQFTQGYGLTEATIMAISQCYLPGYGNRMGSVGVPTVNTEAQIVESSSHKILGPNERGEIWVRGPQIMKGYINKPEKTKETVDSEGWLHTGDIGYYDSDGYFYIVDRIKELIKYKGLQVAPAEIEGLLINHPEIDDVGIIGVPDAVAGELPKAFVVKKSGSNVTKDEIYAFVKEHLSYYKQLSGGIEFVTNIPKSQAGKILRNELRAMNNNKSKL